MVFGSQSYNDSYNFCADFMTKIGVAQEEKMKIFVSLPNGIGKFILG